MTKEVEKSESLAMKKTNGEMSQFNITTKDVHTIKAIYAENATDSEFRLLLHLAKEYELDPMKREIWLVKYKENPAQIFVGRDGYLTLAHRSGFFKGMETNVERIDEKLRIVDKYKKVIFEREFSYKATCKVYRTDREMPMIKTCYENEYSTGRSLWLTKPRTMMEKVPQAQALRAAFNISGVYAPEELKSEPLTPEYVIEDLPKRSEVNKHLLEMKTKEEFELYKMDFELKYGENVKYHLSGKRNNNTETWADVFETHRKRVSGENPFDANEIPEELNEELEEGLNNAIG